MLSFSAESFVFQVAIQKFKDKDIENYNCAGDKIEKNEMGWACGAYG